MIEIENLHKRYKKLRVLDGLNLKVFSGETLVVLGPSGAGKSVLLKQIIGIDHPDQGWVKINGVNITSLKGPKLLRATKQMGMLFQGGALFDSLSIGENTAFYLTEHVDPVSGRKASKSEIKDRVAQALKMVGLEGTQKKFPSELSGGMRKRAALARLIVYRPKLLLYDEPTTGLDPITSAQISELIAYIQEELGATSIVVTHDMSCALRTASRLALLRDGKIPYIGSVEDFIKIEDPIINCLRRMNQR